MINKNIIIMAQKEEFNAFVSKLDKKYITNKKIDELEYIIYNDSKKELIIFISGVGKVNASHNLTKILTFHKDVNNICNFGVAGSLSNEISINDILVATKASYLDVDLTTFKRKKGQITDMPQYFKTDINIINKIKSFNMHNIKYGLILSGDSFITKNNVNSSIYKDFDNPLACDMESTAIAQVAYIEKIPVTIIRSISDSTLDTDNTKIYNDNLINSSDVGSELLFKIFDIVYN